MKSILFLLLLCENPVVDCLFFKYLINLFIDLEKIA